MAMAVTSANTLKSFSNNALVNAQNHKHFKVYYLIHLLRPSALLFLNSPYNTRLIINFIKCATKYVFIQCLTYAYSSAHLL